MNATNAGEAPDEDSRGQPARAPVALAAELMQEEAQREVVQRGDDGGALMELDVQRGTR